MLVTDINTAGASSDVFTAKKRMVQLTIGGTWNSGSVYIQKYIAEDDSWLTVKTIDANGMYLIEHIGGAKFRTFTVEGDSAPVLVAELLQ